MGEAGEGGPAEGEEVFFGYLGGEGVVMETPCLCGVFFFRACYLRIVFRYNFLVETSNGEVSVLCSVAWAAEYLQIFGVAASAARDRDDVVILEFDACAAVASLTVVPLHDQ